MENLPQLDTDFQRKWIALNVTHPAIKTLGDSLQSFARKVLDGRSENIRLVIGGNTGVGKTRSVRNLMRFLDTQKIKGHAITTQFVSWPLKISAFNAKEATINALIDSIRDFNVLVLDDVGIETDPFKSGQPTTDLRMVLDRTEYRPLIVTTNLNPSQWSSRYDERVASALMRNSIYVDLFGVPDYSTL